MKRMRSRWAGLLLWGLAFLFLWLALRSLDWRAVRDVLSGLRFWQIAVLLLVNLLIVLLFGVRWWLILRAQGYPISFLLASAYRLAGFGVSYFTPGPQFGGEPLQVYLVVRRDNVPSPAAAASVVIDRLLELSSNFAFLAFGVAVLAGGGLLDSRSGPTGMVLALALLLMPLGYLFLLARGNRPLSRVIKRLSGKMHRLVHAADWIDSAEAEAVAFIKVHRFTFFIAVLLSGVVWAALVFEYLLAVRFLGLELGFRQVVSVMTAARLAVLLPLPGGLGTLEAALVLVTQALGQGAAAGAGLSLLIRVRDILFGLSGLWLGRRMASSNFFTE